MEKVTAVFALINTFSGQHLVVHRKDENTYGLPGGKVNGSENPKNALVREIYEETGLVFKPEDFELHFIEEREESGKLLIVYAFLCTKIICETSPIKTFEKHIVPTFMEARVFYTLTKYKKFYNHLFNNH